jgi:hypothetical protein
MKPIRPTHTLIKRMVPALAVWAVGKVLETPEVKTRLAMFDERLFEKRRRAIRKARGNKPLFAAGAAAVALGIGLLATAAKK